MDKLIHSFNCLKHLKNENSIACLDSGGLDSAFLITKICELYDVKIHVLTIYIGQEDASPVKLPKNVEARIIRHHIDAREDFAQNYVMPLLFAHGVYAKQHPLSASLSRPLIAKYLVQLAHEVGINTILHAATPSQNSMRRFNGAIKDLGFDGFYGSPYLSDNYSREIKAKYVANLGGYIPPERTFSVDSNLFCREFESGTLKGPERIDIPENMYLWTNHTKEFSAHNLKLDFEAGKLIALDGKSVKLFEAITTLNRIVGRYGLGRYQGLEEGPSGKKVLEVREAPAAYILLSALNELLNATQTHEVLIAKSQLEQLWTKEASEGRWYGTLKNAIDNFNKTIMCQVTGSITFKLSPNACSCVSLITHNPLYSIDRDELDLPKKITRAA